MSKARYNLYDVLFKAPKLHKKLSKHEEALARALLASGKIRIDSGNEKNFTRLVLPQFKVSQTYSQRELVTPALFQRLHHSLKHLLQAKYDEGSASQFATEYLQNAKAELARKAPVGADIELMVARALVKCNAYPVIRLLHLEGAEFFISFGQSVGDVMDIARWQEVGENSGLQAVGAGENAVYVSCGGHPFLEDDERTYTSDGFPALARLLIIAAQETGHNGDMRRDGHGRWIGRYSSEGWQHAPSQKAGEGRRADIRRTEHIKRRLTRMQYQRIAEWEAHLQFYREHKASHFHRRWVWFASRVGWQMLKLAMHMNGMAGLIRLQKTPYPCTQLSKFFADMLFNLTPIADVYRRANPLEEEAVACIEAVARVPQQVIKWGHHAVRCCTPALYAFYYHEIVPACEKAARRFTVK